MNVFVSSTCYDLIDVRAELCATLREIGATPILSEDKGSEFYVPQKPSVNSIEACLENVRRADLVIFLLSQRYGPLLRGRYGEKSATHVEYDEAVAHGKPKLLYVRTTLAGEFSVWRKNKRGFKSQWANEKDARALFRFLEDHQNLHRPSGDTDSNNWYSTFNNSVDLCTDVQKQLRRQVRENRTLQLIDAGQVPILIPLTQSVEEVPVQPGLGPGYVRFTFDVVNAGTAAAINATGNLNLGSGNIASWPTAKVGAVMPGGKSEKILLDVRRDLVSTAFDGKPVAQRHLTLSLVIGYVTPSGQRLADVSLLDLQYGNNQFSFMAGGTYLGKATEELTDFLLLSPWA